MAEYVYAILQSEARTNREMEYFERDFREKIESLGESIDFIKVSVKPNNEIAELKSIGYESEELSVIRLCGNSISTETEIRNARTLLDQLPRADRNYSKFEELAVRYRQWARTCGEFLNSPVFKSPTPEQSQKNAAKISKLEDEAEQMRTDVSDWERTLIDDAKLVRDRNARRSVTASWISIILYTLGWGLGFVGRIYGGGEMAGAG
jgi:hypothetical protein